MRIAGENPNYLRPRKCTALALVALFGISCFRLLAHGDLHERIEALAQQLTAHPANPELWLQRADLRRQHEEFDAAFSDVEKAGQLKPDWPPVPLQRARIYFDLRRFSKCERAATACLKLDPLNSDALVLRARCRARLNEPEGAIADYNAVLNRTNLARPLPDVFLERARVQAAQGRLDDALRGLDEAVRRLGDTPSFALPAIEYERARGDFDAALARLANAKKFLSPEAYLVNRAEILLQAGRRAEAGKTFAAALSTLEKLPPERRNLPQTRELEKRLRAGQSSANLPALP